MVTGTTHRNNTLNHDGNENDDMDTTTNNNMITKVDVRNALDYLWKLEDTIDKRNQDGDRENKQLKESLRKAQEENKTLMSKNKKLHAALCKLQEENMLLKKNEMTVSEKKPATFIDACNISQSRQVIRLDSSPTSKGKEIKSTATSNKITVTRSESRLFTSRTSSQSKTKLTRRFHKIRPGKTQFSRHGPAIEKGYKVTRKEKVKINDEDVIVIE